MSRREDNWRQWILNRGAGVHDHEAIRYDGSRAACPVWNCNAELGPTAVDLRKQGRQKRKKTLAEDGERRPARSDRPSSASVCIVCGGDVEPPLAHLGSTTCHDHRPA